MKDIQIYSKGKHMGKLPSGIVKFSFTDIEDSTKLAWAYPDIWDDARARHRSIFKGSGP